MWKGSFEECDINTFSSNKCSLFNEVYSISSSEQAVFWTGFMWQMTGRRFWLTNQGLSFSTNISQFAFCNPALQIWWLLIAISLMWRFKKSLFLFVRPFYFLLNNAYFIFYSPYSLDNSSLSLYLCWLSKVSRTSFIKQNHFLPYKSHNNMESSI